MNIFENALKRIALIADETTSQGREVLSVCLRLLDFIADPSNPIKREVLIDMCDLPRTTGSAIATAVRNSLQKHKLTLKIAGVKHTTQLHR